jgi:hypothetical protein
VTDDDQAKLLGVAPFELTGRADGGRELTDRERAEWVRRRWGELLEELVRLAEETADYTDGEEL